MPIATWATYRLFHRRDIIWFLDNEAAAAAGIRGCSGEREVDVMVQASHLLWMALDLEDPWTQEQGWMISESDAPPWSDDTDSPDALFQALWRDIGGGQPEDIGLGFSRLLGSFGAQDAC